MKRLLLILTILPLTTFAQTEIYINILTFDNNGQLLPNCDLELFFPNDTTTLKLKSDNKGSLTTLAKVKSEALLTGQRDGYYSEERRLKQLETLQPHDTIFATLTFKPLLTILHGFTDINFDTTFALGQLANLPDTIIIFTNHDQIKPRQDYTKIKKVKSGNYKLWYWEMEKGGIIDPTLYQYDLKVKLKKDDRVELTFGGTKKIYFIRGLKSKNGLYYELTKE